MRRNRMWKIYAIIIVLFLFPIELLQGKSGSSILGPASCQVLAGDDADSKEANRSGGRTSDGIDFEKPLIIAACSVALLVVLVWLCCPKAIPRAWEAIRNVVVRVRPAREPNARRAW